MTPIEAGARWLLRRDTRIWGDGAWTLAPHALRTRYLTLANEQLAARLDELTAAAVQLGQGLWSTDEARSHVSWWLIHGRVTP